MTINSTTSSATPPTFSQNNILLNAGQQTTVYISGTGSYYVSNNSNTTVASVQISGNSIIVSAMQTGSSNISICQSGGQCATLYITVSSPSQTNSNNATPVATSIYTFSRYLGYGDKGDDVLVLQNFLLQQGLLSATPNGRYGPATVAAMKKFQLSHGINQTGNMGPVTKNALNQLQITSATTQTSKQQQILQIQQAIQQLEAQLSALQ